MGEYSIFTLMMLVAGFMYVRYRNLAGKQPRQTEIKPTSPLFDLLKKYDSAAQAAHELRNVSALPTASAMHGEPQQVPNKDLSSTTPTRVYVSAFLLFLFIFVGTLYTTFKEEIKAGMEVFETQSIDRAQ